MTKEVTKRKPGRPSKYPTVDLEKVTQLCMLGCSDAQLAEFIGVNVDTVHTWKKERPEFSDAIKMGKDYADAHVGASLYHRAIGYSHPEEKIFNNQGKIVRAETTKQYPPDTAAAIFWLKNRRPNEWRDKREIEGLGKITLEQILDEIDE